MSDSPTAPYILVVADPERTAELIGALSDPLPTAVVSRVDVVASTGGDDTIDLAAARKPHVVVVTASLEAGDASALVGTLRGMVPRAEVAIVVVGDIEGPIRTALDAIDMAPDRFVARPLAPRTLRFAVASALEAVMLVRGPQAPPPSSTSPGTDPGPRAFEDETAPSGIAAADPKAVQRARWEAMADSIVEDDADEIDKIDEVGEIEEMEMEAEPAQPGDEPPPLPPVAPVIIRPRRQTQEQPEPAHDEQMVTWHPPATPESPESIEPPRRDSWIEPEAPPREPTLIIRDPVAEAPSPLDRGAGFDSLGSPIAVPQHAIETPDLDIATSRTRTIDPPDPPPLSRTKTGDDEVDMAERARPGGQWSEPVPLAELADRDSKRDLESGTSRDELAGMPLDEFDEDIVIGDEPAMPGRNSEPRIEVLDDLPDAHAQPAPTLEGRDFARQLRAKMSMMAQRLFQGGDAAKSGPVDLAPRHDHHTEIDLASLGEETPLGGGVTEIEARAPRPSEVRELTTSPGSWDTQVRERGLPETGEIVRGVSDAPMVLAKMFATGATGRIGFRRDAGQVIEKIVFFDQGRPVFASSNQPGDRMGELLVREGKITAAQYERCQSVVAESGRRMGEILVDVGYLKRRELLPAVRRHVEDIVYSLFGWDRGHYRITIDAAPCAERIRLSRHPAALILEGIRRKFDRTTLEKLIGPPSTVIEVADRERLGGVINTSDLAGEERAALAAFDGQSDLVQVARAVNVDVTDLLPLAWGLCVLGLAIARRTDTEIPDESTALVGETDLAIDRERVRARWQLVTEADYFALLGVRRDATTFEIRRAYQSARRDFAVDSFPTDLRRELAQELDDIANVLDEAFRVLRDDRLRTTYLAHLVE